MTVRIPIEADPSGVTAAFGKIQAAIERAGQQGREFSKLDLSHPELQTLADTIRKVQENFEEMTQFGYGRTAAAIRRNGFNGPLDWFERHDRSFPEEAERRRHLATAGRYILRGTSLEPPSPPPPPPPPAPRPSPKQPSAGNDMMQAMMGPAKYILGMAGLSKISDMAMQSLGQAEQEAAANDKLMRHMDGTSADFGTLRSAVRSLSQGMQLTYGESQRLALSWAKLTNESDPNILAFQTRRAVGFARAYGLSPEQTVGAMGTASYLGEDPKRFALLIAEAVRAGNQGGQASNVMQALLHWSETASQMLVTHTDVHAFAAMYASMNASKEPGLRGAAGEALISRVNSSLMQGGAAGEAGQAAIYQALKLHGITNPYDINQLLAGGMFETPEQALGYGGNETTYGMVKDYIDNLYKGQRPTRRYAAIANMFGINANQAKALDGLRSVDIDQAARYFAAHHTDLASIKSTSMKDVIGAINAPRSELDDYRKRLLERTGPGSLTYAQRKELRATPETALRDELVKLFSLHGMESTQGTQSQQAAADLNNALTEVGSGLLPIITDLKYGVGDLTSAAGQLSTVVGDLYSYVAHDDKTITGRAGVGRLVAPLPRGVRDNNPTNLKYVPGQPNVIGHDGPFGVYRTEADGVQADLHQYLLYQHRDHLMTLRQMILKATPPSDNPNVGSYIAKVAKEMGVSPDAPVNLDDPIIAQAFINAAARQETGIVPNPSATLRGVRAAIAEDANAKAPRINMDVGKVPAAKAEGFAHPALGGGTKLPAGAPASAPVSDRGGSGGGGSGRITVDPLEVIHRNADGTVIDAQHLPVTYTPQPSAWGIAPLQSHLATTP